MKTMTESAVRCKTVSAPNERAYSLEHNDFCTLSSFLHLSRNNPMTDKKF
jgi:hypothetical protein